MDRLLSEQAVIDRLSHWYSDMLETNKEQEDLIEVIKAIPPAEPYKGMTNGEVLCQIFPMEELYPEKMQLGMMHFFMKSNSDCMNCINMNWWNSPYELRESEDKE